MKYEKPVVVLLGCALQSVQNNEKPNETGVDSIFTDESMTPTAYQADE
jgi:hypothetical protein